MHKLILGAVLAICLSTTALPAQNSTPSPNLTQVILKQAALEKGVTLERLHALLSAGEVVIVKDETGKSYLLTKTDGGGLGLTLLEDEL